MTYLDHAATTPLRASARDAWLAAVEHEGNPSSSHAPGRRARAIVEDARERIAAVMGAHPTEVILTSGATEADNLAIVGLHRARAAAGRTRLVSTAIEHHAALDPARRLAARGEAKLTELAVDAHGIISDPAGEWLSEDVSVVSVMWANNETGAVQPLEAVVEAATDHGVPVHSDAVQAVPYLPVRFAESGLTSMAVTAHKVGGPVGVGALLVRRDAMLEPLFHGGNQQRVRSGTLDAPGAAAFAAALADAAAERASEADRLAGLQRDLVAWVESLPGVRLTGPRPGPGRLPGIVSVVVEGARTESLLTVLDLSGIAVSGGSACAAGVHRTSHVLGAMGLAEGEAAGALRISMGRTTTTEDIAALRGALPDAIERARAAGA